jgi:hypothetical protein
MPPKMRFCDPTTCGTLTAGKGRYEAVYDHDPTTSFYAVGEITTTSLTLYRVDRGGKTATLTGKFSAEGNRLLDGVLTWDDGRRVPFNLAWGKAISGVVRPKGQVR